jgi:hypothetical protein
LSVSKKEAVHSIFLFVEKWKHYKKFGKVFVPVIKSGKLQKETYKQFLNSALKLYVK